MNNRLTDKLIKNGIKDPEVAYMVISYYKRTGILLKV